MGTAKDNMKCSDDTIDVSKDKKDKESLFGKILPRKKTTLDKTNNAETYADNIAKADRKLGELHAQKTSDLANERGQELQNTLKVGNLRNQQMHLDAIIDLMNDYVEIK